MLDTTGDEVIESLSRLTRPRMVQLFEQSVGDEGARRLQKALPNAAIIHKAIPPTNDERDAIQWALEQKAVIATDYSGGSLKEVPKTTFFVTGLTMPEGGPKAGAVKLRGIRCIDALLWNGLENADAEAEHLATLDSLVTLQLSGTNLSAKGIERLSALRQLEQLFLFGDSAITDEALSQLPKFKHLWNLQLSDSPITDAGLEHLGHLPDLHFLVLANCPKLNGVGLKHLAALPVLRQLHLGGTPLDDTAIPFLKQLTSLFILDLTRTKITENGVGELHIALPRCAIIWDGGLIVPGTAPVVADPDRDPTK